jgi:signal transduction histidine kinase
METTIADGRSAATRPRRVALVDVAIAIAVAGVSMAMMAHGLGISRPVRALDPIGVLLVVGSAITLAVWRRGPFAVFLATAAASTLIAGLGYADHAVGIPLAPTVALYLLAVGRGDTDRWGRRTTAAVAVSFVAYLAAAGLAEGSFPGIEFFHTSLAWAVAWFAGERSRLLRNRIAALEERAAHHELEAERERRLAVAEERARIARDLHDSAGHAINVIAVRAGAARLRHSTDPDRSLRALEEIEEVARETAGDIDQIVHTLRENGSASGAGPAAPPGLASLETLIAHHTRAGLEVAIRRGGDPRPLAHAADQGAYRIVQEALTNAARHGTGSAAVELDFQDTTLELTIINPVSNGAEVPSSGGHGVIGMRERAVLLGGTLEARQANGSFRVSARIPYRGPKL